MAKKEVLKNCRIEADLDGAYPALIQDIRPNHVSVSIGLKNKWKDGTKVRVTIERVDN